MALTASQVELLYVAFYNRPADPAGLAYWESSSATYGQAANYFGASPEYTAMFTGLTNTQVVAQVYENMFNRLPDPAGLIYWSNLLTAGTLTLGSIALAIAGGAQGTDATILANKVTAATDFTNNIVTTPEILAYSGAAANHQASLWLDTVGSSPSSLTGALGTEAGVIAALIAPVIGTTSTLTTNGTVNGGLFGSPPLVGTATFTTGVSVPAGSLILNDLGGSTTNTVTSPTGATGQESLVTVNSSAAATTATTVNTTGAAFANATNVTVNVGAATGTVAVTGTSAQALNLNDSTLAGAATIDGGKSVTATITGTNVAGILTIGGRTPIGTGAVTVNETIGAITGGAIAVTGGVSQSVNLTANNAVATTATFGAVAANGTANTTSVTVNQQAAATAGPAVVGVTNSAVTVRDATTIASTAATATGTITAVTLNNYANSTIASNVLNTLTIGGGTTASGTLGVTTGGSATLAASIPALKLNLLGGSEGAVTLPTQFTTVNAVLTAADTLAGITDTSLATLNVSGTGVLTMTAATSATQVNVSGAAGYAGTIGAGTGFTSTGSGQDVITIAATPSKAITAGTATNNELIWAAAAPTAIQNVSGFSVLGVNADSTGTFDLSTLTGFNAIDVINTGATALSFTNVAVGTALTIKAINAAGTLVYQTADTAGLTDSVAITLGSSTNAAPITVASLTLMDSVNNGIGNVTFTSNDKTAGEVNTVTTILDGGLSTLTVAGNAGLTVTNPVTTAASTLTINGNSTGTGAITLAATGASSSSLKTLNVTGADTTALTITETGTSFTMTDSATAASGLTITDTSATTESFTNTGTKVLTVATHTGAHVANLTLAGQVAYIASADTVTAGITVSGATDNQAVSITATGATNSGTAAAVKSDSFTLGNGVDTVVDHGAGTITVVLGTNATGTDTVTLDGATVGTAGAVSTQSVTVGNGLHAITLGAGLAGSIQSVTVGNGGGSVTSTTLGSVTITSSDVAGVNEVVSVNSAHTSATITLGGGADTVTTGTGPTTITVGSHIGLVDTFNIGANATVANAAVITGAATGDIQNITYDAATDVYAGGFVQTAVAAPANPTLLSSWITDASAAAVAAGGAVEWFQFGGNTYEVANSVAAAGGASSHVTIVELTGIHNLATSSLTLGAITMHA